MYEVHLCMVVLSFIILFCFDLYRSLLTWITPAALLRGRAGRQAGRGQSCQPPFFYYFILFFPFLSFIFIFPPSSPFCIPAFVALAEGEGEGHCVCSVVCVSV
mmetsp:Transcript_39806/g.102540  ORF Transcript_39806/g.102540 Transcript_39806/m.102540 type:complete len:103 (+) Transcript_39806:5820-6128(+)